jgi:flavin-binding protein dodecin
LYSHRLAVTLWKAGSSRQQAQSIHGEIAMTDKTYKIIEMVGTSSKSSDDAIKNAITRAGQTVRNLDWYEVIQSRGSIKKGKIASFQVTLKIGFRLE